MKSKLLLLLAAALTLPLLTACESEEDRKLAEAEACINRASSGDVNAANLCMDKVAGMESEDAYLIRCSAHFIAQNISESSLSTGFANIKNANSTTPNVSSMTYAMSYLLFSGAVAGHDVNTAMNNCSRSGAVSLYKLVQLSKLATSLGGGSVPNGDAAGLADAIDQFAGDTTAAGAAVLEIKQTFCDNDGAFSGTDICNKVNQAIATSDGTPAGIGALIQQYLDDNP